MGVGQISSMGGVQNLNVQSPQPWQEITIFRLSTCRFFSNLLWHFAAELAWRRLFDSTLLKLYDTFLQQRVSCGALFFPSQIATIAFSPADSTSAAVDELESKTSEAYCKALLTLNLFRIAPFPIPNSLEVASQPKKAC